MSEIISLIILIMFVTIVFLIAFDLGIDYTSEVISDIILESRDLEDLKRRLTNKDI